MVKNIFYYRLLSGNDDVIEQGMISKTVLALLGKLTCFTQKVGYDRIVTTIVQQLMRSLAHGEMVRASEAGFKVGSEFNAKNSERYAKKAKEALLWI